MLDRNLVRENLEAWDGFLAKIRESVIPYYGEELLAAVLFGSAARGDFQKGSDLDLLILLGESQDSMGKRIDRFMNLERELTKSLEYGRVKARRLPHRLEPVILTLEEFRKHPPLLLDLTTDARVLLDRGDVFSREMEVLRRRLQELGSHKVLLQDGRWYWVLKPGIKWGEQVIL